MVTLGTRYIIHPSAANQVKVIPGPLSADPKSVSNVSKLISAISPTIHTVVYIEVRVDADFGVVTATPTIYYKPSGSDDTVQVESLPAEIEAALSNLR